MVAQRIGIVWNPSKVSERELRTAWDDAVTQFDGPRPDASWFETSPDDAGLGATAAALARGCDVVVAAGGDGTVRAVAEALGDSGSPAADLGVVPLGTGNLLARNLGIPLGDARAAFTRVLTREATPLDLGRVRFTLASDGDGDGEGDDSSDSEEQQHGFVVMVGFGIDAQMIVETDDELKAKAGWLAYVESLGRAASGAEVVEFSLALDGEAPQTEHAHTLLIANCGSIQGGITLLPDAQPDDGRLDLLVLRAADAGAWLDTMRNFVWHNGLKRMFTQSTAAESTESTEHLQARRVSVVLPEARAFEIDGDDIGEVTAFTVEVLPEALRVR
ncbi:diacylglycerol/lipid kinase family protein [Leucobacter japonicus]|uniref:diacylglycerol/lipid kinase family protein n=1 Tax=Leucobacter japonicus TaxID=1461259 RepID=UPI0006A7D83F|nr:diacylglycerol kinase family protein [Leucobacter japonicus]